jgi:hypothetical protein
MSQVCSAAVIERDCLLVFSTADRCAGMLAWPAGGCANDLTTEPGCSATCRLARHLAQPRAGIHVAESARALTSSAAGQRNSLPAQSSGMEGQARGVQKDYWPALGLQLTIL